MQPYDIVNPASKILSYENFTIQELFILRSISKMFRQACEHLILQRLKDPRNVDRIQQLLFSRSKIRYKMFINSSFVRKAVNFAELLKSGYTLSTRNLEFCLNQVQEELTRDKFNSSMSDFCKKHLWSKELIITYRDVFNFNSFCQSPQGLSRCGFSWSLDEIKELKVEMFEEAGKISSNDALQNFFEFHKALLSDLALLMGVSYATQVLNYFLNNKNIVNHRFTEFIKHYETLWSPRDWKEMKHLKEFLDPKYVRAQQRFGKIKWSLDENDRGFRGK